MNLDCNDKISQIGCVSLVKLRVGRVEIERDLTYKMMKIIKKLKKVES